MLRLVTCAGVVLTGAVFASSARAACPQGDAPGPLKRLTVVGRDAVLDVDDGHAELTVTTRYENRSDGPADLEVADNYDGTGAVTGAELRVGTWHRSLALADVLDASATYAAFRDALSSGGAFVDAPAGGPRVSAVVELDDDGVDVRTLVAMACSVRTASVTTHALISSTPDGAGWRFHLPISTEGRRGLTVNGTDGLRAELLQQGGAQPLQLGTRVTGPLLDLDSDAPDRWDPDGDFVVEVRVTPPGPPSVRARGAIVQLRPRAALPPPHGVSAALERGALPVDTDVAPMMLVHAEVDVPPGFAPPTSGLRIVFVVDNSVSVGAANLLRQRNLIAAMLRAAPEDAVWTIVPLGRTQRSWAFQPVRGAHVPVLPLENGSDVLGALARAESLAADVENIEQARVIVLSDLHVRTRDAPVLADAFGATDVLTHVVTFEPHGAEAATMGWARQFSEESAFAQSVERTGGILVNADGGDEPLEALAAHLIAPTRIDRPHVMAFGHDVLADAGIGSVSFPKGIGKEEELIMPPMLSEGSGLRLLALVPVPASRGRAALALSGQLWGRTYRAPLNAGPAQERVALAALVSDEVAKAVPDAIVLDAAARLGAVSRMTSFVYAPQWRPIGEEAFEGVGTICTCGGSSCSGCGWGSRHADPPYTTERAAELLERLVAADARACGAARVEVTIETDELEILDVRERRGGQCVVDKIWEHRLDERARHDVALQQELQRSASFDIAVDVGEAP